ncbi:MarR family winged helix-turn-helix transcriptional regulator [Marinitenerispora sediminis]|uniref:MarR family transcriptional regulator n=1 Tax=Marinitenerispora sediminis TaxID=1931232 RepID=A0A368T1L6_9ACTN|nr:MarR family winged helix-turn-helix transcriptional regulator [Marinitenerispora sediminis]RCV51820.1 MarR family transcriptional regulator [Marinitenerispora sediminis]RCV53865.1 MarR family transcriptional regulator [Marinitenerispora sediminis]RCV54169.1 MarR family transcriptional regulator [Marinitenerispora sediminis]
MADPAAPSASGPDPGALMDELERETTLLVRRAMRGLWLVERGADPAVDRHTYPLLAALAEDRPMRVGEVARRFHLNKSTASRHLRRLTDAGLVEAAPDPLDRRSSLLTASPAGRDRIATIRRARADRLREALAAWPESDRRDLARLLGRLNADLDHTAPPGPPAEGRAPS